jgi:hypothetical protein
MTKNRCCSESCGSTAVEAMKEIEECQWEEFRRLRVSQVPHRVIGISDDAPLARFSRTIRRIPIPLVNDREFASESSCL